MKSNSDSKQTLQMQQRRSASPRVLYETLFIIVITFAAQFLWKDYVTFIALVPTLYFFIERRLRRRTWQDVGFKFCAIPRDMADNWFLILFVSVIIQFLVVFVTSTWMPAFLVHVLTRLSVTIGQTAQYVPVLLIGALWEEINFRALYQERVSWFISTPFAIGIISIVFAIGHWANGDPIIVLIDILLVFVDSVFYGIIFARSKNIFVAWIAHFLANLFGIGFYLLF